MKTTIALTRLHEPDWLFRQALDSLAEQVEVDAQVLVLDQSPDKDTETYCARIATDRIRFAYIPVTARCLSHVRNIAIEKCVTPALLYIDCDAVADPDWAYELTGTLMGDAAAMAGGRIVPRWHGKLRAIHNATLVREQYSLLDLGEITRPFHKVVGASFGIRPDRLGEDARFREDLGRRAGTLMGGEETDMCRRALARDCTILYNGKARVQHQVLPERLTWGWALRRLYSAGMSRRACGGTLSPTTAKRNVWDYIWCPLILTVYFAGWLGGSRRITRPADN